MISNDEYSKLLDQQFETKNLIAANKIISGKILKISDQYITVDIGYKSEGQIPKEEFLNTGASDDLKKGLYFQEPEKCPLRSSRRGL